MRAAGFDLIRFVKPNRSALSPRHEDVGIARNALHKNLLRSLFPAAWARTEHARG
jgi:hypothetical protein